MTLPHSARKAISLAAQGAAMAAVLGFGLAGCERFHAANSLEGVSRAQQADCKARTEQAYTSQNRGEIYRTDTYAAGGAATPFSGPSTTSASSDALGARYAYQRMLNDCYNSSPDPVPVSTPKP